MVPIILFYIVFYTEKFDTEYGHIVPVEAEEAV